MTSNNRSFAKLNLKTNEFTIISVVKDSAYSESIDSLDLDTEIICAGTLIGNIIFIDIKNKKQSKLDIGSHR